MLAGEGYECIVASDGIEALQLAIRQRPDLVLIDPEIAGLDGSTFCQALRIAPTTSLIPIMYMSPHYSMELLQRAIESGAMDYLQKPLDGKVLLARILRCTAEQYVMGQNVFLIADECPISFPTKVTSHAESCVYIEKPEWGEDLDPFFCDGTFAELHHAAPDFSIYRRRVTLGKIIPGEPEQVQLHVDSGVYRSQRRQIFRKDADLQLRYRLPGSFFRVATLIDIGGFGLRISGIHDSAAIGDDVSIELRTPMGLPAITAKVVWMRADPGRPTEAGVELPWDVDPSWVSGVVLHLFLDQILAIEAASLA